MNPLRHWLGYKLLGTTREEIRLKLARVCRSWMDAGYRLGRAHGRLEGLREAPRNQKPGAEDPGDEAVRESWERYGR